MASEEIRIGVVQAHLPGPEQANVDHIEERLADCAAGGANVVVVPELFEGPYFCGQEDESWFARARPLEGHPVVARIQRVARDHELVVPVSFFERDGQAYYNSVAVVDADGRVLGRYRKSHIPDGPGYEEKFYFRPGDTGFRVWQTRFGRVGVGICWDQWFPECARVMMVDGADVLLYPSTIGSEPHDPDLDTSGPWRRVMIGHAVANAVPLAAANRCGKEGEQRFYGGSFVADHRGEIVAELDEAADGVVVATVDLAEARRYRAAFGFFRDRRPDLYTELARGRS